MNSQDAIRIVGEARDYGWNPQCLTCEIRHEDRPNLSEAVARLEADARALWAVRVLDAWSEKNPDDTLAPRYRGEPFTAPEIQWEAYIVTSGEWELFPSPDAARLAAAEAVFPELPADVRAKLGERP